MHPQLMRGSGGPCSSIGRVPVVQPAALDSPARTPPLLCRLLQELGVDTPDPACFCPRMIKAGYQFLFKRVDLGAAGISCTEYCAKYPAQCAAGAKKTGSCKAPKTNMCSLVPSAPQL